MAKSDHIKLTGFKCKIFKFFETQTDLKSLGDFNYFLCDRVSWVIKVEIFKADKKLTVDITFSLQNINES
jgi:hypothetical protein